MSTTAARTVSSRLTASHGEERPVGIPHGSEFLTGSLASVPAPRAVVLIANDRGYGRHVPALRALADELRIPGFATLIADVVPAGENCMGRELDAAAARLASARAWLASSKHATLPVVLFGMGAAAPAALLSAAARPGDVAAVVACGPNPDAPGIALGMVSCPALLIAHTGQFGDVASHIRALGRLGGRHDLAVLSEVQDTARSALDIARATVPFLSFVRKEDRRAA